MKQNKASFTITVSGLPVTVTKKNIKHLYIRVKPAAGLASVSAPRHMRDEAIISLVEAKAGWIEAQMKKRAHHSPPPQLHYQSGETLYVWGKPYTLQVQTGPKNALALIGGCAILTMKNQSTAVQRAAFVREWYRKLLKTEAARLLPVWEARTGLRANSWQTKVMKTRWGTCNPKAGRIWLNVHLAEKEPACLEYVIVHELMHLRERRHNARFYALMDQAMPAWRTLKAKLSQKPSVGADKIRP